MIDEHDAEEAVSLAASPESPTPVGPNTLALRLVDGQPANATRDATPLMAYGAYDIGVDLTARYSGRLPMPVRIVAVSRETGRVYVRLLLRSEDHAPIYRGDQARPKDGLILPDGSTTSAGISESGQFSVDLKRQLALPDAAGSFDVFLWLENIASPLMGGSKRPDPGTGAGGREFERQPRIASIKPVTASAGLRLAAVRGLRQIAGSTDTGRVSIVAYAVQSGATGWTVLGQPGDAPFEFNIDVARLLPDAGTKDRVLVFAVGGGRRSALLDLPGAR